MSAAVSLQPPRDLVGLPFDWRTIAPEEWPYVADLLGGLRPPEESGVFDISSLLTLPVAPPEGAFDRDPEDGRCSCGEACAFTPGTPRACLASSADTSLEPGETADTRIGPPPPLPRFTWFLEYEFFRTRERDSGRLHEWAPPDPKNDRARTSPPRWTDCDDRACVDCAPVLERRSERAHEAMVSRTLDVVTQDWTGELFGTGEKRTPPQHAKRARTSRAIGRSVKRIKRLLSADERGEVLGLLADHPVRRCYLTADACCSSCPSGRCRCEWVAEALLEIENPSALVASRETDLSIAERAAKAINRAQAKTRESNSRAVYAVTKSGPRRLHNAEGGGF